MDQVLFFAPVPRTWLFVLLALVAAQRLLELLLSRRHEAYLRGRGATEIGAGHYPFIVAVHAGWLAALALWAALMPPVLNPALMVAYLLLQPMRACRCSGIWRPWAVCLAWRR